MQSVHIIKWCEPFGNIKLQFAETQGCKYTCILLKTMIWCLYRTFVLYNKDEDTYCYEYNTNRYEFNWQFYLMRQSMTLPARPAAWTARARAKALAIPLRPVSAIRFPPMEDVFHYWKSSSRTNAFLTAPIVWITGIPMSDAPPSHRMKSALSLWSSTDAIILKGSSLVPALWSVPITQWS